MLRQTFEKVFLFLDQDGVFLFDMKTAYFYEHCLGDQTITDNREDVSLIWENAYDKETGLNEYLLTIFAMVDESGNYLSVRRSIMYSGHIRYKT